MLCVAAALGLFVLLREQAEARDQGSVNAVRGGPANGALAPFIGKPVALLFKSARTTLPQEGTLEAFDGGWLRLRGENGTVVCYNADSLFAVMAVNDYHHALSGH
jgi:hypothetical protein